MCSLKIVLVLACIAMASASLAESIDNDTIPDRESFIVGGSNANPGQFPWHVSVQTANANHFCGGAVINIRWVLTAGHCAFGRGVTAIRLRVGTNVRNRGGVSHNVAHIRIHPQFNRNTLANDIAVLQTVFNMTLNNMVRPIPLASGFQGVVNAQVVGFGQTSVSYLIIYVNRIHFDKSIQKSSNQDNSAIIYNISIPVH